MHLFKKCIKTIRYYCKGKGNPWRLILVWYFLLNAISLTIGFGGFFSAIGLGESKHLAGELIALLLSLVFGVLGLIITFIYPILFIYAIWQCAFNVRRQALGYFIRFLIIPFIFAHFILSNLYLLGSKLMVYQAFLIMRRFII